MADTVEIILDGKPVQARRGQTVLQAAQEAGVYIPRLCHHPELSPAGHCRLCTVKVNGRPANSCTLTVAEGMVVENETLELRQQRRSIIELLFVEGNHFCPFCEVSGDCELQALGYRLGMVNPVQPFQYPRREVDASHPDVFVDPNRCVLCSRCIRASSDLDHKVVFAFEGRGEQQRVVVNAPHSLSETDLDATDAAARICPTGSIVVKRTGYRTPIGQRRYDQRPIGSEVDGAGAGGGAH